LDFIDLANLRYDLHVKNGRVQFTRFKGGTSEFIDNIIIPEALVILEKYKDNAPYLINIHKYQYTSLRNNYLKRFGKFIYSIKDENNKPLVESYFTTKTARYTFINLGKQLELNRDVVMEITGHSRGDVHSIYEGSYSYEVKDAVHRKIIDAVLNRF
jgi:integrase